MIKKILSKFNTKTDNYFEQELFKEEFDEKKVTSLFLSQNIDLDEVDGKGNSYLHKAVEYERLQALKWLVYKGCILTIKNKRGFTPLRLAIEKGRLDFFNLMLRYSEHDVTDVDFSHRSLLQDAVIHGQTPIISNLIEVGIDVNHKDKYNRNVAFDAISYGDEKTIDMIVTHKDIDLNVVDVEGNSIMHNTRVLQDDTLATKLLENGADPTICDKTGHNFLSKTALRGVAGEAILEVAIRCGCDLNKKIASEKSILMEVMIVFAKIALSEQERRNSLKSIAKTLIRHGIDIDAIDKEGENILFSLVRFGDIEGCAFVLENGINLNQQNRQKQTPLSLAILKGVENLDLVLLLLQYGADPTIKDKNNKCTLELLNEIILHVHNLIEIKDKEVFEKINPLGNYMLLLREILMKKEKDYNYLDSHGNPLFFSAILHDYVKLAQLYIKNKVDINLKNARGHNIFYEYVLKAFEKNEYSDKFRDMLTYLLMNSVDRNAVNNEGQNIYTKVASFKNCNLQLFRHLIEVTRHDYKAQDNMGRSIMHYCVFNNNLKLLELIYGVDKGIEKIYDNYNILPITYAALFGHKNMVRFFIKKDAIITSSKPIPEEVKKKFRPHLKNFHKIVSDCIEPDCKRKLEIVEDQLVRDFKIVS